MKAFLCLAALFLSAAACDTGPTDAEVTKLRERVNDLELRLIEAENALAEAPAQSLSADEITALQTLLAYMVIEEPNFILEGANLTIRAGSNNPGNPDGTGNLIIGYNRRPGVCEGGSDDGDYCDEISGCSGAGVCDQDSVDRGGSHNVIIGERHAYAGSYNLLVGERNTAMAGNSLVGGLGSTSTNSWSTAIGSHATASGSASIALGNFATASGDDTAVCGGYNNEASGSWATVVGGRNNLASGSYSLVTGGDGNEASGTDAIAP